MIDPRMVVWLVAMLGATLTPIALLFGANVVSTVGVTLWLLAIAALMSWLMRR